MPAPTKPPAREREQPLLRANEWHSRQGRVYRGGRHGSWLRLFQQTTMPPSPLREPAACAKTMTYVDLRTAPQAWLVSLSPNRSVAAALFCAISVAWRLRNDTEHSVTASAAARTAESRHACSKRPLPAYPREPALRMFSLRRHRLLRARAVWFGVPAQEHLRS
jgi:hypothetical protein